MNYQSLVMTTCAIVAASAESKSITTEKKLVMRPIVGAFGLGIFLFIFGMANQSIGQKFCYLVMITAVLTNGNSLISMLTPKPQKKG